MTRTRIALFALVAGALGLGVGLGRISHSTPQPAVPAPGDARVLHELEKLDARVRQLSALTHATASARAQPAADAPALAVVAANELAADAEREAPTAAQVEAGDRLVALTDRIIASGRVTADDRRALREAASQADDERRDETILALVREVNQQRVRPTEPGPLF